GRGVLERDVDADPRPRRAHRPLLRRRLPLGAVGRQPPEDGLHQRHLDGRRNARLARGGGTDWPRGPPPPLGGSRPPSRPFGRRTGPATPARASAATARRSPATRRPPTATRPTGASPSPASATPTRGCCWSAWPPPPTAPTVPAASSPATARATSSSPRSTP